MKLSKEELELGEQCAIECGYDWPTTAEVFYYARIEKYKAERARRGIPISPP